MKKRVVTFGEIMLRLNPPDYYRFIQAEEFKAAYTGAEANISVALSRWGYDSCFVTALPDNDISECALATMRKYGVDVSNIIYKDGRMGLYFLEKGASQRPSKVIYDRKYTAFSNLKPEDFDWDRILNGADWFHVTGITPPLGPQIPEICLQACRVARDKGIKVSVDLNYRKTLWSTEDVQKTMSQLVSCANVIFGNEEDAEKCLGIKAKNSDVVGGLIDREGYVASAQVVRERFGCEAVLYSLRTSKSASDNTFQGLILCDGAAEFSKAYDMHIVDRVGGGDSFAGAAIYAMLEGFDAKKTVEFATAASCLKHSIPMDFNLVSVNEVMQLMNGDGSGRVQR